MNHVIQTPPTLRRAAAATLAVTITALLFLIMQSLIATQVPVIDTEKRRVIDPVMPPRPEPEPRPDERVEKPLEPEEVPQWDTPPIALDDTVGTLSAPGNEAPPTEIGDIGAGAGSSTIVPVFRIAPEYPARALSRGIEGHVDLIFDVAASGRTENIRVLAAEPEGVFERAAMRTLAKWKYKAPVQDGVPYGQKDMTTRISFRLEN